MSTTSAFSFQKGNLQKLLYIPAYVLGFLLAWCIPRNRRAWAFGSGAGFGEGALVLARELRRRDPEASITWIASTEEERERAEADGFVALLKPSWSGFWATLRAGTLVVTHGLGDVQRFAVFRARVINLWHGAPLKRLHLDSPVTTQLPGAGAFARLLRRMYLLGAAQVDVYIAGSVLSAERLRSAFRVLPGRVKTLGDARLDPLIASLRSPELMAERRAELGDCLGLSAEQRALRWVLYAPTWRDGQLNPAIPDDAEARRIAEWAERLGVLLFIRSHPLDQGHSPYHSEGNVVSLPASGLPDITPYLGLFETVITDYSSLAIDFALSRRPIIWFAPDLAEYSASRGLYEPYEVTTEGHYSTHWGEVLERAGRVLELDSASWRAAVLRTSRLADRFHAYEDGNSARRILDYVRVLDDPSKHLERGSSVFFESFYGTSASCNPLALDREISRRYPGVVRYWSVVHEHVELPEGAVPLLVGSPEWYAARRIARLLIVNDWTRFRFRRRRGQFVLQTWHGTPLKKLARDRAGQPLRARIAIARESRRWNALLAQSAPAADVLKRSYGFRGEVLVTGYPRNDQLARASHEGRRLPAAQFTARMRLGLDPAKRVLLYAPTWRDHTRRTVDTLNVAELALKLGDEWIVLARGHSRDASFARYSGDRVIDVTAAGDVNDLILASDVCITDYSSLMFDVSVACVPIILFTPDIEEYRSRERGFTFDIERHPPGPLLTTNDEVVDHLRAIAQLGDRAPWIQSSDPLRAAWRARWNACEDGFASERVVDWLRDHGHIPLQGA